MRYFRQGVRYGAEPYSYMANWRGVSPGPVQRGSRELGSADWVESGGLPWSATRAIRRDHRASVRTTARWDARTRLSPMDLSGGPPARPSGPEPLDPGAMPDPGVYTYNPGVQSVGADLVLPATPPTLAPQAQSSGFLGLSRSETRAAVIGAVALGGYLWWKKRGSKRK